MLRVAVVGAGGWGKNLARVFSQLPRCELAAICDVDEQVLAEQRKLHPQARCTPELGAVLGDPEIAAVVVAVDAPRHHAIARAALEAGKHVFVEKPLTLEVEHARELVALAARRGLRLMVGHLLLYHPAMVAVKQLCDAGELGEIHYLYSQRLNLGIIRSNENAWWSLAPHDLSVVLWLYGALPVSVQATGATYLQKVKAIEDVVFATLRFADGRLAQLHVSWLDPHKMRKLTIVGARKMLVFDDTLADEKLRIYDKGAAPRTGYTSYEDGVAVRAGSITIPNLIMREPLALECAEFRDCVVEGRAPRTAGESGLDVVRVLQAGERSLAAGGAVVALGDGA
jgi:predicted dehydrogenase